MKYVPLLLASIAVGVGVVYALYLTKNPMCLWGLLALWPIGYFTAKVANPVYKG